MKKYLIHAKIAVFSILIINSPIAAADQDLDIRNALEIDVATSFYNNDFSHLESLSKDLNNQKTRTPSGKWMLAIFENALIKVISIDNEKKVESKTTRPKLSDMEKYGPEPSIYSEKNAEWNQLEIKLQNWEKEYPKSSLQAISHAILYLNKANYFRGTQYSKYVREEAWPIYRTSNSKAREILDEAKKYSNSNPIWHSTMIEVAGRESPESDEITQLTMHALAIGHSYPNIPTTAFLYMAPKWGGSYERMLQFAKETNRKTMKSEQGSLFARLYWNFISSNRNEINTDFFNRTKVNWQTLANSFDSMIKRYPVPRNLTGYALFACLAQQPEKAKELLASAGTLEYFLDWPKNIQQQCGPH